MSEQPKPDKSDSNDGSKIQETMEKAEDWQKQGPGGKTHEDEVGDPVWGKEEPSQAGEAAKQQQHGGARA
jgi:hypothetical protein